MRVERSLKYCPQCGGPLAPARLNDAERLACTAPACGFVFWDNPVPVVAAIVEHDGCIVLANNRDWPEHWFSLITGFLEKNESPEQAVVREVREELGIDSRVESLVGLYAFEKRNQLIIAFHVSGTGEIRLGEELRSYKRVDMDRLKPWETATGYAVRDWLARRRAGRGGSA